tara:strand:+ start:2562 stop:2933 length:372 start_codon:yes stop_codon:yes gene_type:complete
MEQTTLDLFAPKQLKERAMERVDQNANEDFRRVAMKSICSYAIKNKTLTANDIWDCLDLLGISTHDNRALGPMFQKAAKEGWIEKTNMTTQSNRSSRHCGDVRIWKSLLFSSATAKQTLDSYS